ncbi:MAG: hypothetical protein LBT39_00410 [Treponema sp.]|jgi:hypothetical protein|nr:hypothetical protein [Treponema sp.]
MRKFLVTIFILLALGGVGFFFGWAQLKVPPGSYGVMRSKTHGIDGTLIREGDFRWVWYKLIPTNVDIRPYRLSRVERTLNHRGTLPSADVYAAFAGVKADFSYELNATLSFSIGQDALVPLIREQNILGQEELDAYAQALAREIEGFVRRRVEILGEDGETLRGILETGTSAKLEEEIRQAFPAAAGVSCHFSAIRFPDHRLYVQIRDLYTDYLTKQREYVEEALDDNAGRHIDSRFRLDELARYGELLTRYPVLLDYLKLEE